MDVKVPSVGESVKEGQVFKWHKKDGEYINRDEVLVELETDKATVEIVAEGSGVVHTLKKEGETVKIGDVLATIDASAQQVATASKSQQEEIKNNQAVSNMQHNAVASDRNGPAVQRMVAEGNVNLQNVVGSGKDGRVTKADLHLVNQPSPPPLTIATQAKTQSQPASGARIERREPMTMLRKRIAERLLQSQQSTAMLTTFNEVDMTQLLALRKNYKEKFEKKYGIGLGFMSFFVKAAIEGLKMFPAMNGWIEGNEIVYHDYYDVGVAVSTERGLMVPVLRNAERLNFAEVELAIGDFAKRAREGKIKVDELSGGTFTVSNGGVFGSLLSTPILNPPQSGILGMHKTQDRPVVENGQVVIKPMMYLAVSYDHRIVDGKEAVQFLVQVKNCIEDPSRILIGV